MGELVNPWDVDDHSASVDFNVEGWTDRGASHSILQREHEIMERNNIIKKREYEVMNRVHSAMETVSFDNFDDDNYGDDLDESTGASHQYSKQPSQYSLQPTQSRHHEAPRSSSCNNRPRKTKSPKRRPSSKTQNNEDALDDEALQHLKGPEATIRYLRAQLTVARRESQHSQNLARKKIREVEEAEEALKSLTIKHSEMEKVLFASQNEVQSLRVYQKRQDNSLESRSRELRQMQQELEAVKKVQRRAHGDDSSRTQRLNRALGDVAKYKRMVEDAKNEKKHHNESQRADVEKLDNEVKILRKQKNTLVTAFRKQSTLVEILRRQKTHLEAAKMLDFTEAEFQRVLSLGEK